MTVTKEQQLRDALRRAYHFGQTYWQQADSESYAQNKRADETAAKFAWHVDETVRQFIEQSQDRGHAPAPTDEVLRYVKGYLEGRDDWIGIEDLIGDIDRALAAPAPAPQRPVAWMHEFTDPHTKERRCQPLRNRPRDYELQPGDAVRALVYATSTEAVQGKENQQ